MSGTFSLVLKTHAIGYTVAYEDGLNERYVATYTGNMDLSVEQQCESANTGWLWTGSMPGCRLHAADGKRCTCRFRAYILRKLAMINRAGEQFPSEGDGFEVSPFGCDDAPDWLGWHEQRCEVAQGGGDNQFLSVMNQLKCRFDGIVLADSEIVLDYFKYYIKNVTAVSRTID